MSTTALTDRARHIARGLLRTKRATRGHGRPYPDCDMVRLDRCLGGYFWIGADGSRVLRGHAITDAEELQLGFADLMARAGGA